MPASSFAGKCVSPRSGTDPESGLPYNEIAGTATDENNFLRSWSNDLYLWYNEIVDRDPSQYTTPEYFSLLKTTATTTSGAPKDKFHFTYSTADWLSLSQSGVEAGYGALWAVVANLPPRRIVVAYTEPGSPAASSAAFARGAEVLRIDGVDVVNSSTQADIDVFVAGLYPDSIGEQHTFLTRDRFGTQRTVALTSAAVTKTPVPVSNVINFNGGRVGYLLFNDHILTAEQALITAIEQMRSALVNDLVLDLRYNGGGYLFLASELAYMIAGPARTSGQTFEKLQFNDKHPSIDPISGQPLTPVPFLNTSSGNQPLPTLNLPRVYVLTGGTTCSASESIINSLRGVGVQVIQIGSTTCGKPYGFYPEDNCGTTYFSIQFKGVNAAGFGDYTDGFSPNNAPGAGGTRLQGCSVADDFNDDLGAVTEDRLQAALNQTIGASCPAPSGRKPSFTKPANDASVEDPDVVVQKSPLLMNRILEAP
ncbi:MAG TPA: S41 family peptidase [Gammaproteobacteria bacterium]|nr:S41 family peptidase [Gammaproteobacteria bacterium]